MEKKRDAKLNDTNTRKKNPETDDVTNFTNELDEEFAAETEDALQYDKDATSEATPKLEDEDTQKKY